MHWYTYIFPNKILILGGNHYGLCGEPWMHSLGELEKQKKILRDYIMSLSPPTCLSGNQTFPLSVLKQYGAITLRKDGHDYDSWRLTKPPFHFIIRIRYWRCWHRPSRWPEAVVGWRSVFVMLTDYYGDSSALIIRNVCSNMGFWPRFFG